MENKYINNVSEMNYRPKMVYNKPKLIKIDGLLPPVTVNFAPPAVETCLEDKVKEK